MAPKVSEEHRKAVVERILVAAGEVFARSGYNAASMDDIVRASGLSKGAIYGHFESKEEIFFALQDRVRPPRFEEFVAPLQAIASPTERLRKAGEIAFGMLEQIPPDAARLALEYWISAPRMKPVHLEVKANYQSSTKVLADMIKDGVKKGEFRRDIDAEALAELLVAVVDGLQLHDSTVGLKSEVADLRRTFTEVILNGIAAGPGRGRK